ncbi:MAG: VWA domain-containing protein [Bryobacteraceae bacterium]
MRALASAIAVFAGFALCTPANELPKARQLEKEGDRAAARIIYQRDAQAGDLEALAAYADFLDRHRDPDARAAYGKLLQNSSGAQANATARRLVLLDLIANDRAAATRHYEAYKSSGGGDLTASILQQPLAAAKPGQTVSVPGPLRSFARMAALSPDLSADDLLPALARNVVTNGYQAASSNEALEQTEYLKLVVKYLSQARELEKIADGKAIQIGTCDSTQTADLLRVLGYRMRGGCGSDVVETVNASRAFLTIDSGFPLAELEQALRTNRPFQYDFRPTQVPVLYGSEYWQSAREKQGGDFIDTFLSDPSLCRLYLGLSKIDEETAGELKKLMPATKLKAFAHVLDFYGGMFQIRNGAAIVPGGERAYNAWSELIGKSPKEGAAFYERLLTRDDGWLASYYDSLARISGPVRDYLLDTKRLQRFYSAMRGKVTSPGPARPVFRASTDLMLLTQRLRLETDGKPHVPGNLEVWKNLFINHPHGKYDGKLTKAATGWKEPDDLIEAVFALSRKAVENEPLKIYMSLSDLNRHRSKPLEPATVDRLAREYRMYGAQYSLFAENPAVSDKTVLAYLDAAQGVGQTRDQMLRADVAGSMQSLTSLWQIFCRQGSIEAKDADASLAFILSGFGKTKGQRDLFEHARASVQSLLTVTKSPANVSAQDRMLDLLAGTGSPIDADSHRLMVQDMMQIFEAQRLVSLETIFALADHIEALTKGEKINTALVAKLASKISEIQLPRASLSNTERNSLAFGYWTEKHVEAQRKLNIRNAVEKAGNDPEKLRDIRGLLAPFLRDTLVGFNYLHYAPPGAQILQTNPLFVRTHDFLGVQGSPQTWKGTEVFGTGWPSSAGGRLVGSLSGLPYALAEAEQNFMIPSREQALIWGDLVPQLILSAKVPRWWNVTPVQLHWVSLHMNEAETLLAEAALNPARRAEVLEHLSRYAPPARVRKVSDMLERGEVNSAFENVTPSEMFTLAAGWWLANPSDKSALSNEARAIVAERGSEVSYAAISRAFGTPKPTLTNSYQPELLHLRTFPTLMGYSSRIMAESWESNLLFYAALADDVNMQPSQLNISIPAWTQQTIEKIFATHLEDWPALLRSLRLVGEDVKSKNRKAMSAERRHRCNKIWRGNGVNSSAKNGIAGTVAVLLGTAAWVFAQDRPMFRIKVDMVVLSFTVTDSKGRYINGLKPKDFRVTEDGIAQKLATFAEGNKPPIIVNEDGSTAPIVAKAGEADRPERSDAFVGTNVFVLFDTSNYMYRGFVYASDAIADFVRGLDRADSVALYTYSRNLSRAASLTRDRNEAILGLRKAVAGDGSALYNGLLRTLRDAATVPGRKVVIVFSNGPDNASMVAPDDVRAVAEDEGIPIYVISTNEVNKDAISSGVFRRISTRTGGKAYFAKTWQKQVEAFESIREDLGNSYTITYYPQANANEGFRKIAVEVVSDAAKKFRVRARPGYRPRSGF